MKRCLVIMPYGKYNDIENESHQKLYRVIIKPVVEACGFQAIRADELEHGGGITRDLIERLHDSDLVIADLSGWNAKVFYELGVRHALHRCGTIPLIREGESLPFDFASYPAMFYPGELDKPAQFQQELEKRIKAFERFQESKSDNPVHDTLGDKLTPKPHADYIEKKDIEGNVTKAKSLIQEAEDLRKQQKDAVSREKELQRQVEDISRENDDALQKLKTLETKIAELENQLQLVSDTLLKEDQLKPVIEPPAARFRSHPAKLAIDEISSMLKKHDFYCRKYDWNKEFCNPDGKGIRHKFEMKTIEGDKIIFDGASELIWQQSGSTDYMTYKDAKKYIESLNITGFAGSKDWSLPTLEQAMSLMEHEQKNENLYIDPEFDSQQRYIWTTDLVHSESQAWVVFFSSGFCGRLPFNDGNYVRAVRSGKSPSE